MLLVSGCSSSCTCCHMLALMHFIKGRNIQLSGEFCSFNHFEWFLCSFRKKFQDGFRLSFQSPQPSRKGRKLMSNHHMITQHECFPSYKLSRSNPKQKRTICEYMWVSSKTEQTKLSHTFTTSILQKVKPQTSANNKWKRKKYTEDNQRKCFLTFLVHLVQTDSPEPRPLRQRALATAGTGQATVGTAELCLNHSTSLRHHSLPDFFSINPWDLIVFPWGLLAWFWRVSFAPFMNIPPLPTPCSPGPQGGGIKSSDPCSATTPPEWQKTSFSWVVSCVLFADVVWVVCVSVRFLSFLSMFLFLMVVFVGMFCCRATNKFWHGHQEWHGGSLSVLAIKGSLPLKKWNKSSTKTIISNKSFGSHSTYKSPSTLLLDDLENISSIGYVATEASSTQKTTSTTVKNDLQTECTLESGSCNKTIENPIDAQPPSTKEKPLRQTLDTTPPRSGAAERSPLHPHHQRHGCWTSMCPRLWLW